MLNSLSVRSGLRMNFGDCGLSFFSPVSKSRTGLFFFQSGPVQSSLCSPVRPVYPPPPQKPKPLTETYRKPFTYSRKCNGDFIVYGIQHINNKWEVRHSPNALARVHNHEPSPSIAAHPSLRKLEPKVLEHVKGLIAAGNYKSSYYVSFYINLNRCCTEANHELYPQ